MTEGRKLAYDYNNFGMISVIGGVTKTATPSCMYDNEDIVYEQLLKSK